MIPCAFDSQPIASGSSLLETCSPNKIARHERYSGASNFEAKILNHSNRISAFRQKQSPQPQKIPRLCDNDPRHARAVARHVERLGGPARHICWHCLRAALAAEAADGVRQRFRALFVSRPPGCLRARGAILALAALPTLGGESFRGEAG